MFGLSSGLNSRVAATGVVVEALDPEDAGVKF